MDRKSSAQKMIGDLMRASHSQILFEGDMIVMTESEREKFRAEHPGAHLVIGDFEIKCLKPEKYNL